MGSAGQPTSTSTRHRLRLSHRRAAAQCDQLALPRKRAGGAGTREAVAGQLRGLPPVACWS
eukprot:3539977-Alexandrium_andersonii.AAC.1